MTGPPAATLAAHRSGPARLLVLAALVVVLTASVVVLGIGLATRSVSALGVQGDAQGEQRQREDVMAQAQQFMLRVNTYGPDLLEGTEMPTYRKLVSEVITPKFDADFEKNVPAAEATVSQGGLARSAVVYSTGVSTIDDDSATALVAGAFTNSYPDPQDSTKRVEAPLSSFRVQVELVKIGGDWLVDDFDPITGLADDQQTPPSLAVPSVDPSLPIPSLEPGPEPSTGSGTGPSGSATP